MKGLLALQDLSKLVFIYGGMEQYKIIEEELKALEIIKKKNVDIDWYCGLAGFTPHNDILTDEEYELLKEVLK